MTLYMNIGSALHYISNRCIRDLYKQLYPGQLYTLEHVVPKSIINNNNYEGIWGKTYYQAEKFLPKIFLSIFGFTI